MNDQTVQGTYYEMLTSTAALMREQHGPEHKRHVMWAAMATLLAAEASHLERNYKRDVREDDYDSGLTRALAVARAYLDAACECFVTPESQWLSAASCGYGSGYEPGSQMEPNPECPVHGESALAHPTTDPSG